MAKKLKFESFKYRFLIAAHSMSFELDVGGNSELMWDDFLRGVKFHHKKGEVDIEWQIPAPGIETALLSGARFYLRGDSDKNFIKQRDAGLLGVEDPIKIKNDIYFKEIVMRVANSAGFKNKKDSGNNDRINNEREFHDAWAKSEDVTLIDVRASNEVCTAPEMRYITHRLGDVRGKKLLDIGCGLGEASVYFASLGADVTSSDLSQGMVDATAELANANGLSINPHIASAEDMRLSADKKFDIIYTGNLLHHVDIEETITRVKPHLASGGVFVSWDPLAYNPAINVYRSIATDVRTPDEHPLRWKDIKLFHKHFENVETRYFWLTTLIIFVLMAIAQRRNPNKERFWKVVVQEGDKWEWLYRPLERVDGLLLKILPPLRLLCWNVVIVASKPRK